MPQISAVAELGDVLYGLRMVGDREKHVAARELGEGRAEALCGKILRLYPLQEGDSIRVCPACEMYMAAARLIR